MEVRAKSPVMPPSGQIYRHQVCLTNNVFKKNATTNMNTRSIPKPAGLDRMFVADSSQMMKRMPPAMRKSLRIRKDSGKGNSSDMIFLANLLRAPIAQMLQEILAPKIAPIITPGHARDHITKAAKFLDGSGGPRKRSITIPKKMGTKALWRIAG
jgi:hypothetical protein